MKRKMKNPEEFENIILNLCYKLYPIVFILWAIMVVTKIFVEVI